MRHRQAGQDRAANIGEAVILKSNTQINDAAVKKKKLKYAWAQISGPDVKLKGKPGAKNRSFIPTTAGTFVFRLQAGDGVYESQVAMVSITVEPSITVTEPTADTIWTVGSQVTINWNIKDINPNRKLGIVYSPDNGTSSYWLKRGVKAGKGSFSFKVKQVLVSNQALIGVCLLKTAKNDFICGRIDSAFQIQ